jgi:hypothetical protein
MRNKEQVIVQIFDIIETLKQDIKTLEELVQQVVSSKEASVQEILVNVKAIAEDKKPASRKPMKAERCQEGKRRAQEWVKMLKKSK